jgi:hypothetical protein
MTKNCEQCRNAIEELLDNSLMADQQVMVEQHLQHCPACRAQLEQEQEFRYALAQLPSPALRPGFVAEVMGKARQSQQRTHRYGFAAGFGTAIAASVAMWFTVMMYSPQGEDASMLHTINMSVGQVQQVNLVFNSPEQLGQATFTLLLPENAEVEGYPGRRELTWTASLQKGKNRLTLPLRVAALGQGELVARISHGKDEKVFRVKLEAKARSSVAEYVNRV